MSFSPAAAGLMRALAFFHAAAYAPTPVEWLTAWDAGAARPSSDRDEIAVAAQALQQDGTVVLTRGRVTWPDAIGLVALHEEREVFFPRKLKRARAVARYLSRLHGVRFVALCNTAALAHAADGSDLDFFVVARTGSLWQTRLFATAPFKLLKLRPDDRAQVRDAVCLSFFVDDSALDLSALALKPDDPYLCHWFLSLFPLYDDGMGESLWEANTALRVRHPFAPRWQAQPSLLAEPPTVRWPMIEAAERVARPIQIKAFPTGVKQRLNQGTEVVANDHVLKFHVDDARDSFRSRYVERCQALGIEP